MKDKLIIAVLAVSGCQNYDEECTSSISDETAWTQTDKGWTKSLPRTDNGDCLVYGMTLRVTDNGLAPLGQICNRCASSESIQIVEVSNSPIAPISIHLGERFDHCAVSAEQFIFRSTVEQTDISPGEVIETYVSGRFSLSYVKQSETNREGVDVYWPTVTDDPALVEFTNGCINAILEHPNRSSMVVQQVDFEFPKELKSELAEKL